MHPPPRSAPAAKDGIQNRSSTEKKKPESSTWNLESMAWDPESKTVLDEKRKRDTFHPLSPYYRCYLSAVITFSGFPDHWI